MTGSTVAALTGTVDGTNSAFTVPAGEYTANTLQVYLNGVLQVPGDAITETSPSTGVFTFIDSPATGDQLYVVYSIGDFSEDGVDKNYTEAFVNQSSLTITHNLNKYPSVTVIDSAETIIEGGELVHLSTNSFTLDFTTSFTGTIICN